MISVSELAKELGLDDHELRAVAKVAGVKMAPSTMFIDQQEAQRIRGVLAGEVPLPRVRKRPAIPPGKLALLVGIMLAASIGSVALVKFANRPGAVTVFPDDCFNAPSLFTFELNPVPCSEPHKYKAYARLDLGAIFGEEYPGEKKVEARAKSRCDALYLGERDPFGFTALYYFFPREGSWNNGARHAVCATRD